jgi:dTDP-4-amino-4,6-dideoxygalactose transaminase
MIPAPKGVKPIEIVSKSKIETKEQMPAPEGVVPIEEPENTTEPTTENELDKKVEEFEEKLKKYFNYPYLLTLNSATSGLTLAYRILDLKQGIDKVISTPLTCFATNASILANNLDIVWADTDPHTCNIDLDDVKKKINSNTY